MLISPEQFKNAKKRLEPTWIRLWDGDWNLITEINGDYEHDFEFENNDAGSGSIELPLNYWVSELLADQENWPTRSLYVTFDRDGVRWSGRVESMKVEEDYQGDRHLTLNLIHDYVKLKELIVWSNPFLPAEVQFPKAWVLFGPAKWAVATTLLAQLHRKNQSLWMLPDDPGDLGQWFDLDLSDWNMVVKPSRLIGDNSLTATVTSRFRTFHSCVEDILEDAQLTIDCRRYLEGDPDPIPGKKLRHGCLVFEVIDKSGWNKSTAFGGNLIQGLNRAIRRIGSDGMTEGIDYVPRGEMPEEYKSEHFMGTLPEAPWVVLEHGEDTGVDSFEFEYTPPGAVQHVTGGSSMPGVNEAMSASIITLGGLLGSLVNQSQVGAAADRMLEPLYSDVFMAFMAHKMRDRIQEHGWDAPFERWADGSDKAYTIDALGALRASKNETREVFATEVEMNNGAPYWVGPPGHGDFWIGDRVAVHAVGMPENRLMVEMVQKLRYSSSGKDKDWKITIGKPRFTTGMDFIAEKYEEFTGGLKELGVW